MKKQALAAGKKKVIHVNRHHIAANHKDGGNRPVFTIKHGGKTTCLVLDFVGQPDARVVLHVVGTGGSVERSGVEGRCLSGSSHDMTR